MDFSPSVKGVLLILGLCMIFRDFLPADNLALALKLRQSYLVFAFSVLSVQTLK